MASRCAFCRCTGPLNVVRRSGRTPLARRTFSTANEESPVQKHPYKAPPVETFSQRSRPQEYHTRPRPRELPPLKSNWPPILAFSVLGVGAWAAFMAYTTNQERLSSSVMQRIMETLRESPELHALLGEAIRPEPVWWLNGDPWIHGAIHLLQGNVDLSFRVKGHKGAGTVYFTSIRKNKGDPFTILRFKVIGDDGTVVNIASAS